MITKELDNSAKLKKIVQDLDSSVLLVGIPGDSNNNERPNTELTNSILAYMYEFGEPLLNMPSQPFLEPTTESVLNDEKDETKESLESIFNFKGDSSLKILTMLQNMGAKIVDETKGNVPDHDEGIQNAIEYKVNQ